VVIEGERGIGKTRLSEAFLHWVSTSGDRSIRLRSRGQGFRGEPLGVLRDLLDGLRDAPGLAAASPAALATLADLMPWLRERFPALPGSGRSLSDAVIEVLDAVAGERPTVVFVDDLQDSDRESLAVLLAVARSTPDRVMLLVASASDDPAAAAALAPLDLVVGVRRFKLLPLTRSDVDVMIGSMVAMPSDERQGLAARVWTETGGVPFYVAELVSALADEGLLAPDSSGIWRLTQRSLTSSDLPIPIRVRDALGSRLARLSPVARQAVAAAAVFAAPADSVVLERLSGLAGPDLAVGLDELVARRILRHAPEHPASFEFCHELMRRAIYDGLDPSERASLHGAAAEVLVESGVATTRERSTLGYHQRRAGPAGWRGRRVRMVVGGVAVAAAVILAIIVRQPGPGDGRLGVVVLPFRATTDAAREWAEALPDLVTTALDGTPGLRVLDPWAAWRTLRSAPGEPPQSPDLDGARSLARRLGATRLVLGSVVQTNDRLTATVRLYQASRGDPEPAITEEAPLDSLVGLAHRLTLGLMAQLKTAGVRPDLAALEGGATRSPAALKAYLAAKEHLRRGALDSADAAIDRAIVLDSSFALAHVEAAAIKTQVAAWSGRPYQLIDLAARASRHADSLGERNRLRVESVVASVKTDGVAAVRAAERIIEIDSTDLMAWVNLSYYHAVYGWQYGRGIPEAIAAAERVVRLDSTYVPGVVRRATLSLGLPERDDAQRQLTRLRRLDTTVTQVHGALLGLEAVLATDAEVGSVLDRVINAPQPVQFSVLRALIREAPARSHLLLDRMMPNRPTGPEISALELVMARLFVAEGRMEAVDSIISRREAAGIDRYDPRLDWVVLAAAIAGQEKPGLTARSLRRIELYAPLDSILALFESRAIWRAGWLLGAYHASRGDTGVAGRWLRGVETFPWTGRQQPLIGAIQADLRSRLAHRAGDRASALREAERAYSLWGVHTEASEESSVEPAMRFHLAERLRDSGPAGQDRAEGIFRSLTPPTAWMGFLSTRAALALGELVEARGQRVEAARWYRRAATMWERADPPVAELAGRAVAGAKRLAAGQ
jgi:hypothetical protein